MEGKPSQLGITEARRSLKRKWSKRKWSTGSSTSQNVRSTGKGKSPWDLISRVSGGEGSEAQLKWIQKRRNQTVQAVLWAVLTRSGNSREDSGRTTPKKPKIDFTFQMSFSVLFNVILEEEKCPITQNLLWFSFGMMLVALQFLTSIDPSPLHTPPLDRPRPFRVLVQGRANGRQDSVEI